MRQLYIIICLLVLPSIAKALDASDVGTFAVIHKDGHVTNFTFFASFVDEGWNIEQKMPDGTWSNVTCEHDCVLHTSTQKDISQFFPAKTLAEITPSCVHNTAFAFCNYRPQAQPDNKGYIFIALITAQPKPLLLKKLSQTRL